MVPAPITDSEPREDALERVRARLFAFSAACDAAGPIEPVLRDALALCRELSGPSPLADSLNAIDVSDVAFVAAVDLRATLERLGSAPESTRAEEQARAFRRVLRALGVIGQALGLPRMVITARDRVLQTSLATRRRYASLRRAILSPPPPSDAITMARSLARVRLQVTLLARSDQYASLREGDRTQMEELRARLDRTLADRDAIDVRDATHLWQDLAGFARLSAAINRRHELVENDTTIIDEATEWLDHAREIPTRLRMRLAMLSGLDDDIDALIERYEWNGAPWREALAVLHERLVRPATGRFVRVTPPR